MERAQLEQNIRDSKERMEKLEGYWMEAQSLCKVIQGRADTRKLSVAMVPHHLGYVRFHIILPVDVNGTNC